MPDAAKLEQLASTRSAPCRWTPCRRPTAAIPARRWPWRRWPTRCGTTFCATIRTSRLGPIAIGSCSRAAMPRCCFYSRAAPGRRQAVGSRRPADRRAGRAARSKSSSSANWTAAAPAIPNTVDTRGVETTTGPLGQGIGNSVGMAIAVPLAGRPLQPARLRAVRFQRLRPVQRRRFDGRRPQRSGLDGRPSEALESLLDLRRQPHHDRRRHVAGLQRRRGHAVRRLRLERHPRAPTPTILEALRARYQRFLQQTTDRADDDHRPQPHRLRLAAQARQPRSPRRTAGRRRSHV